MSTEPGSTERTQAILQNTFEYAPDVPVSKFRLELFGGKRGLVILSSGLCANRAATVKLRGHNGATYDTKPKVKADCGGKGARKKRSAHRSLSSPILFGR